MKKLRYFGWEGYADNPFAAAFHRNTGLLIDGASHVSDDLACRTIAEEPGAWDILNINTPFVRDVLHPLGLIHPLAKDLAVSVRTLTEPFARFTEAAESHDGMVIGIPQRCGPFNLVINTKRLSPPSVREQGFGLALDPSVRQRFGILGYEDFNVMHIAIAGGLNPFEPLDGPAVATFSATARTILESARIMTADHNELNRALVDGEIDFYLSGGTYTASPARLSGCLEVMAITPNKGPIDGKGAVAFVEINALIAHPCTAIEAGEQFLRFIDSDDGALAASTAAQACNPVVQMHRPSVFHRFKGDQLVAMQWDDFEHDMSRCADYAIMPDYKKLRDILRSTCQAVRQSLRSVCG